MLFYAFVLSLAISPAFDTADASGGTWRFAAPQQRLFRPLLADPTEARLAVTSNLGDRLSGDIGGSWEAADYVWNGNSGLRFRTGIHAGVFSKLRRSGTTFPLETADYLIGFHADLGNDRYTGRFEYAHVSAHLADGYEGYGGPRHVDKADKASHVDRSHQAHRTMRAMTYSREYFTLYGAREMRFAPGSAIGSAIGSVRVYGSLRWSNHAIPDVRRWRVQGGAGTAEFPEGVAEVPAAQTGERRARRRGCEVAQSAVERPVVVEAARKACDLGKRRRVGFPPPRRGVHVVKVGHRGPGALHLLEESVESADHLVV